MRANLSFLGAIAAAAFVCGAGPASAATVAVGVELPPSSERVMLVDMQPEWRSPDPHHSFA